LSEKSNLLNEILRGYEAMSYSELAELVGSVTTQLSTGKTGKRYQVEVQLFWDTGEAGDIRVIATIDEGGLSAFFPTATGTLIRAPARDT
jgi:hypothetical protein